MATCSPSNSIPPVVLVLADDFLLLRVDADHRLTGGQERGGLIVEVAELGVPLRMLCAPLVLALACNR
jgi:hypothetical protein